MTGKGKGSWYTVSHQKQYQRRKQKEGPEYVEGIEMALKIAGLA